ncbi:hypothetical protein DPMN_047238 [Dreissena polymorpha]|uniref:Uncharacterized protein n=1 Tax=Dreissena polymorpha TaxID=45954 RepID=A0A9D4D9C6_DREPO|nr:hypothetical protein DPMN_047238 [Dreissena polymorpha]
MLELKLMDGQSNVTGTTRRGLVEVRLTGSDDEFGIAVNGMNTRGLFSKSKIMPYLR